MAMKYWRMKFKGERPVEEIEAAVGQSGGNLVRIHFERGETHAYFAAEKATAATAAARSIKDARKPEEVTFKEVTKLG